MSNDSLRWGAQMSFDLDAFISYAHLDNCSLIEGHPGWITNLHRALELKVTQLLGKRPEIWRDPKLQGNDVFSLTILDRVRGAAVLITILSPCYLNSEWTRKELVEFWKTAEAQGGVVLHDKARIFKVLKTPVRRDMHPPELQSLLGYEFFEIDPDTKKVHELDEVFGNKAQISFWMKLDDLAQDICALLMEVESFGLRQSGPVEARPAIFLAEATLDIKEQREMIRRDLQRHGYTVLPAGGVPMVMAAAASSYRDDLGRCRISIHLFGKDYGFIPEGSVKSIGEIQNDLAIERGRQGDLSRLVSIQPGLAVEDERQKRLLEQLRTDPLVQAGADVLETRLEDLRTVIHDQLTKISGAFTAGTQSCARVRALSANLPYLRSARCEFEFGLGRFPLRLRIRRAFIPFSRATKRKFGRVTRKIFGSVMLQSSSTAKSTSYGFGISCGSFKRVPVMVVLDLYELSQFP